jgi:hypothetical protein
VEPSERESIDKADEGEQEPEDQPERAKAGPETSDWSIFKLGSSERDRGHGIEAAAMDPRELEAYRQEGVPDLPLAPLADRLVRYLVSGALEAAFWKTAECALQSLLPGASFAVKPAHVIVGLVRAALSLNNGHGVDLVIPVVEIAGGYSADLRLRLCEAQPPPLPSIGMSVGWSTNDLQWLNQPALDGTPRPDRQPKDSAASVAGMNTGADMMAVTQRWLERAFATPGRADGIDIHVVTFVNPPAAIGRVELWPSDGPPSCHAWFRLHSNSTAPEAGGPYTVARPEDEYEAGVGGEHVGV